MRPLRTLLLLSLPLALAALPACSSSTKPSGPAVPRPKVAFVSNNADPFWSICEAGCRNAESAAGVEVVFKKPGRGDAAEQKEIIDSLVNQDIKAVAISVIDPNNQTPYLNEVAAKVPLLAVDNDAPASKRLAYIGTDNYAAGREVGKLIQEALPQGGTIAVFVGQLEALNARQRRQGLLDELAGRPAPPDINTIKSTDDGQDYGKYKLFKTYTDQPEGETKAKANVSDALIQLQKEPNVCLIGLWAYNPPAILSAVKDQNKLGQVKIVGFDENPNTLQGVGDGHIVATVVQDPFNFGVESVKLMAALAKGQKYQGDAIRYVKHRVVAKDAGPNRLAVEPFRLELLRNTKGIR